MPDRRALTFWILAIATLCLPVAPAALAGFSSEPAAPSMTISTATLAAPTGLGASVGSCTVLVSVRIDLSWTATSSTFADGYEIARSLANGGPYTVVGSVGGQATATASDTVAGFSTTYYYVVRATKGGWRSPDSGQASVTTPTALCL